MRNFIAATANTRSGLWTILDWSMTWCCNFSPFEWLEKNQPMVDHSRDPMRRYCLPRRAIRIPLARGKLKSTCAYNGRSTHWTADTEQRALEDNVWSYEQPQHDAESVRGYISC